MTSENLQITNSVWRYVFAGMFMHAILRQIPIGNTALLKTGSDMAIAAADALIANLRETTPPEEPC